MNVFGIAGPSCAGKNVLASWLAPRLRAAILSLDEYYLPLDHLSVDERAQVNFDHPAALDEQLLVEHLRALKAGLAVNRPVYDFALHTRKRETVRLEPQGTLLLEGLFTLHWASVRQLLQGAIFITAPDEVCLARRIERDQRERGRSFSSIVSQYESTVRPMRKRFVDPTAQYAGLVLDGVRSIEENGPRALAYLNGLLCHESVPL